MGRPQGLWIAAAIYIVVVVTLDKVQSLTEKVPSQQNGATMINLGQELDFGQELDIADDAEDDSIFVETDETDTPAETFAQYVVTPPAISSGDSVFLKASTGKMLSLEGTKLVARDDLRTVQQSFFLEKDGGGAIKGGDTVYLKSEVTGQYVSLVGSSFHATATAKNQAKPLKLERRSTSGTPNAPIQAGDTIGLKAEDNFLRVNGLAVTGQESPTPQQANTLTIEKEGVSRAYCCAVDSTVTFLDLNSDGQNGLTATKDDCEAKCAAFTGCKFFQLDTTAAQAHCVGFSECPRQCPADIATPQTIFRLKTPDDKRNVVQGKDTAQSSTASGAVSNRAVDGNTNQDFSQNSCTATRVEWQPWWRVDLNASLPVDSVTIWNRADCCGGRLANAEVRVGDKQEWSSNPTCDAANNTANNTIAQGQSQNVQCNGKSGKYVFIDIPGRTDSLTLCEVEVFKQGLGNTSSRNSSVLQHVATPLLQDLVDNATLHLPNVALVNYTFAPYWFEDTLTAAFRSAMKVAVAMSTGILLSSDAVQILGIFPVTHFKKGEVRLTSNDTDPVAGNPPPAIRVALKVSPGLQGTAVSDMAGVLKKNAENEYTVKKLQDRLELAGIVIEEYKPAFLTKLTVQAFEVDTTCSTNCSTWDVRCNQHNASLLGDQS